MNFIELCFINALDKHKATWPKAEIFVTILNGGYRQCESNTESVYLTPGKTQINNWSSSGIVMV